MPPKKLTPRIELMLAMRALESLRTGVVTSKAERERNRDRALELNLAARLEARAGEYWANPALRALSIEQLKRLRDEIQRENIRRSTERPKKDPWRPSVGHKKREAADMHRWFTDLGLSHNEANELVGVIHGVGDRSVQRYRQKAPKK